MTDARDIAERAIASEEYKDSILRRAATGTLPPAVEETLWSLAADTPSDVRGASNVVPVPLAIVKGKSKG